MILSNNAFYSIYPVIYGILLALFYYVLFPKTVVSERDFGKLSLAGTGVSVVLFGMYWLLKLFKQVRLQELLFPPVILETSFSWIALLTGTAWIFVVTTLLHSLILGVFFSLSPSDSISWVVSANFISYLLSVSITLFLL